MIRIIDNKKVDLTTDEFALYNQICKDYTRPNFKGEDLFQDLFETDEAGRIVFLKPPKTYTTMEVFMFLMGVMVHQHLGIAINANQEIMKEMRQVLEESKIILNQLKQLKK